MKPPPSSLAPVCEPVSQVSICPPASTIWLGSSDPGISNTKLDELQFCTNLLYNVNLTLIGWPLFCILWNISASSTVIAAHGIFTLDTVSLYYMYPVWTEYILEEATERTNVATASYLAAIDGPSTLYGTDWW